jgi:hypothetical protein
MLADNVVMEVKLDMLAVNFANEAINKWENIEKGSEDIT